MKCLCGLLSILFTLIFVTEKSGGYRGTFDVCQPFHGNNSWNHEAGPMVKPGTPCPLSLRFCKLLTRRKFLCVVRHRESTEHTVHTTIGLVRISLELKLLVLAPARSILFTRKPGTRPRAQAGAIYNIHKRMWVGCARIIQQVWRHHCCTSWASQAGDISVWHPCSIQHLLFEFCHETLTRCSFD